MQFVFKSTEQVYLTKSPVSLGHKVTEIKNRVQVLWTTVITFSFFNP